MLTAAGAIISRQALRQASSSYCRPQFANSLAISAHSPAASLGSSRKVHSKSPAPTPKEEVSGIQQGSSSEALLKEANGVSSSTEAVSGETKHFEESTEPPYDRSNVALAQGSHSLAQQYLDGSSSSSQDTTSEKFPGATTGARAKGAGTKSSIERRRQKLLRNMFLLGATTFVGTLGYLGRDWDSEEEKSKIVGRTEDGKAVIDSSSGGVMGWIGRAKLRFEDISDYLNKPAWDPLLPPPLPEPMFRPYTLVLDLDDLLIHSKWDVEHGWRTAKRPGVEYFLAYLSQFYEIVLFTTQPAMTAGPIIEKIDPYGAYILWKLYRESTRYKNKALIKDLSYLGRPLERTIILDSNASHFQLQPDNGIAMTPWQGANDSTARELVSMIPFLEAIAIKNVKDVRPVIKYYAGKHIPTAYAEAEAKQKQSLIDRWERERSAGNIQSTLVSALGSIFRSSSRDSPPETDVEKVRKNAQRLYLEEQKYWKENEESIKKQMDEDREKQMKELTSSLYGLLGLKSPGSNPSTT